MKDWKRIELKELIEKPISGEWGKEPKLGECGVGVIRSTNFTNEGKMNLEKGVAMRSIGLKKIEKKALKYGDIIIEKSGGSPKQPVGRVIFFDKNEGTFLCSNFTSVLRPNNKIEPKYLHYQLFAHHKFGTTLGFQNKTTGIINLQLTRYVEKTKIPLPSLLIQEQIAKILDTADALRRETAAQLADLDALAQSVFLEMFGDPVLNEKEWSQVKLETVCTKITDGTHKTPKYQNDGVIFLSAKNIKKYQLNQDNPKYISQEEHEQLTKRSKVEKGDVLITKSGSLGMAALVKFDFEFSIFESLALMKYKRDVVNGQFLVHFLNTPSTQFQYKRMTKGVGVKHLHLKDLRSIKFILPDLELQTQFAQIIQNIESQKSELKQSLQESEDLFNGLLQEVFG